MNTSWHAEMFNLPVYHPQSVFGTALMGEDMELTEFLDLFLDGSSGDAKGVR